MRAFFNSASSWTEVKIRERRSTTTRKNNVWVWRYPVCPCQMWWYQIEKSQSNIWVIIFSTYRDYIECWRGHHSSPFKFLHCQTEYIKCTRVYECRSMHHSMFTITGMRRWLTFISLCVYERPPVKNWFGINRCLYTYTRVSRHTCCGS